MPVAKPFMRAVAGLILAVGVAAAFDAVGGAQWQAVDPTGLYSFLFVVLIGAYAIGIRRTTWRPQVAQTVGWFVAAFAWFTAGFVNFTNTPTHTLHASPDDLAPFMVTVLLAVGYAVVFKHPGEQERQRADEARLRQIIREELNTRGTSPSPDDAEIIPPRGEQSVVPGTPAPGRIDERARQVAGTATTA